MHILHALIVCLFCFLPTPARGEIKVIDGESVFVLGDNDSKVDSRRIATQDAKRRALESAGTYISSLTEVRNYRLSKDDIAVYTAGIVEADVVYEEMRGTASRPEMFVRVRCRIDSAVLARQVANYRENDDLKAQLDSAVRENEALRKERDALLSRVRGEKDKEKAAETRKQLDGVLSREEANDEVMKYWKRLAHRLFDRSTEISKGELDEATTALVRISREYPKNSRARFLLASMYQRNGDYAAAEAEIRGALAQSPDNSLLHMKLGSLLKQDRKYDAALQEFFLAQKGLGDHPHLLFHFATTYQHLGNCPKAVEYANRFVERIKRPDKPVSQAMNERVRRVLKECGRGEVEPSRRR